MVESKSKPCTFYLAMTLLLCTSTFFFWLGCLSQLFLEVTQRSKKRCNRWNTTPTLHAVQWQWCSAPQQWHQLRQRGWMTLVASDDTGMGWGLWRTQEEWQLQSKTPAVDARHHNYRDSIPDWCNHSSFGSSFNASWIQTVCFKSWPWHPLCSPTLTTPSFSSNHCRLIQRTQCANFCACPLGSWSSSGHDVNFWILMTAASVLLPILALECCHCVLKKQAKSKQAPLCLEGFLEGFLEDAMPEKCDWWMDCWSSFVVSHHNQMCHNFFHNFLTTRRANWVSLSLLLQELTSTILTKSMASTACAQRPPWQGFQGHSLLGHEWLKINCLKCSGGIFVTSF